MKINELIKACEPFIMLDDRLLVHPLKLRTYEFTDTVIDEEASKGLNPMVDELKTMKKVIDVNYKYQEAVVLNVSENIKDLAVGDTIIYKVSNLMEFDMVPEVSLLKRYEVIAKVDKGEK